MKIFITGGAGFIGSNLSMQLLKNGNDVTIYDNLSRKGSEKNLKWLTQSKEEGLIKVIIGDIKDKKKLQQVIPGHDIIYHTAAQVSADTSIQNPIDDFETNIIGTLNILEIVRKFCKNSIFVYTSTNKVYRPVTDQELLEDTIRFNLKKGAGFDESSALEFFTPYGCSKGSADQYVNDYHRMFDLRTITFRQSAIYGKRQFGNEEQGWVAHIYKQALMGKEVKIFGNGKQVRDILYIDDLISAFTTAVEKISITNGKYYNIGGGAINSLSILELLSILEEKLDKKIKRVYIDWRLGDQKFFVSNVAKAKKEFGWEPKINYHEGLKLLEYWLKDALK